MRSGLRTTAIAGLIALALATAGAAPARALELAKWQGHLSFGFTALFADTLAPGGSFSLGGGLDYPIAPRLRLGVDLGYHLLGSGQTERGSLSANVDYSLFDFALLAHWEPANLGPIQRVSIGGGFGSASAELSTAGGGAGFSDLAVGETRPEFAFGVTLMPKRPMPVRAGFEAGLRIVPVRVHTWTLITGRLAIHY